MMNKLPTQSKNSPDLSRSGEFLCTPKAGIEPATDRLTADCSTAELLWNVNSFALYSMDRNLTYIHSSFSKGSGPQAIRNNPEIV